jgi:GH18 family chitinase
LRFIQSANAKGIKTWLRIGSQSKNDLGAKDFSDVTADPMQRSKLISLISATLEKYEMDGVFIYWKYPGCPVAF